MSLASLRRKHSFSRKPMLEVLEDRNLLAVNSFMVDAYASSYMDREISQLLSDPGTDAYSGDWIIGVADGQSATGLAAAAGVSSSRPTNILDEAHAWTFSPDLEPSVITGWLQARKNSGQIAYFYPLLAKEISSRFLPNDPNFPNQWHLRNTGQSGATAGIDLRTETPWDTVRGRNIQIGVVDTGISTAHPDLSQNIWVNPGEVAGNGLDDDGNSLIDDINGWDFLSGDNNPNPTSNDHGTSIAGIIGARGNNATGVAGVAFESQLVGIRLTESGLASDLLQASALNYQRGIIDIYNNSWGPADGASTLNDIGPLARAVILNNYITGRGGLGNVYVWANGNGGTTDFSHFDGYASQRGVIAVAGVTGAGIRATESERGSNILVSGLVGSSTTGMSTTNGTNTYTSTFGGGTSAAAASVSGVVALMLEARPDLTARDVQHILVRTSRQIDVANTGWSRNNGGTGFFYNDAYGFGLVDANAAVNLARTWTKVTAQIVSTSGLQTVNLAIPDSPTPGPSVNFINNTVMNVEHVEVAVNLTHTWRGDLVFILTSPRGTITQFERRSGDSTDNLNWTFMTPKNWGEDGVGTWNLKINDLAGGDVGNLISYQITVYGGLFPTPPTGAPDNYSMLEDQVLNIPAPGVLANDSATSAQLVSGVAVGTLNFNTNGSFIYTPPANFFGVVSFTYRAVNDVGQTGPITVTINVQAVNDAPVALNDGTYIARPGYNFTLPPSGVLANDSDVDNASLISVLLTSPIRGNIAFNNNGSFSYLAAIGTGIDTFQYRAYDGFAFSNPATVTLQLNTPPVVQDASVITLVDAPISGNALSGASDFDGNSFTAQLVTGAANGTVLLNSNGFYSYTPNPGFFGIDTFTFRANDQYYLATPDQVGNTGTITIRVNRPPVTVAESFTTKQGETIEIFSPGLLANDSDADTALFGDVVRASLVSSTTNGTLTFDQNGYFKYVPNAGFYGSDSFDYQTYDGMHYGNIVTVQLTVNAIPVANPDSYFTLGTTLSKPSTEGLLVNDFSPNISPLTARTITSPYGGTITVNPDGSFDYIAATGFVGLDQFTYVANDGIYDSLPATVSILVYGINYPPHALDDSYATPANTPLNVLPAGVLGNDTDPQGAALNATIVNGTSNGTLQLNFDGSFFYTPQPGFNGVDTFTYQASNGAFLSNVATVTITVGTPPPVLPDPLRRVILGKDTGGELKVLTGETGAVVFTIKPYGNGFTGAIRVATGDVNADGTPDIVTAPGAGSGGTGVVMGVRVFNGLDGTPLPGVLGSGIRPYGTSYTGGIQVAVGDITGDGRADIVTGADVASTTNQVRSFNGANGNQFSGWFGNFKPYTGTTYGGIRVAVGDVTGDGRAEIITSPGAGTPVVRVYNTAATTVTAGLIRSFNAYSTNVSGGVFVAAGDLDGDGKAEIVTGAAANTNGHVRVFNGSTGAVLRSKNLGTGTSGAARVALGDINGDGNLDIVVGQTFTGQASKARVYDAITLNEMFVGDPKFTYGGGYTSGLFVAALGKTNTGGVGVP